MDKPYICESCGYNGTQRKLRTVGSIFGGNFMEVDSCMKCNWFIFENDIHKELVLNAWKNIK